MVLGDKKTYDDNQTGSEPDASYLVKEYDTTGTEAYNNRLVADILRFTALIDFTDENIGSNQSGIGFRFKGWGSDNDRKNKERMIKKAIMRRLRLLTYSWSIKEDIAQPKGLINMMKAIFVSPNSTQQSLYDRMNEIEILSEETLCEMAERLTGVPADEELKRVNKERPDEPVLDYEFPISDDGSNEEDKEEPVSEE